MRIKPAPPHRAIEAPGTVFDRVQRPPSPPASALDQALADLMRLDFDALDRLLSHAALTPEARRQRRLDRRDETLTAMWRQLFPGEARCAAAASIAKLLADPPPDGTRRGDAAMLVLRLNHGQPIGARQIAELLDGWRGR
jgi:hypothetical protein